jgi:hypothetical protein
MVRSRAARSAHSSTSTSAVAKSSAPGCSRMEFVDQAGAPAVTRPLYVDSHCHVTATPIRAECLTKQPTPPDVAVEPHSRGGEEAEEVLDGLQRDLCVEPPRVPGVGEPVDEVPRLARHLLEVRAQPRHARAGRKVASQQLSPALEVRHFRERRRVRHHRLVGRLADERHEALTATDLGLLASKRVVGSSPISRFVETPRSSAASGAAAAPGSRRASG